MSRLARASWTKPKQCIAAVAALCTILLVLPGCRIPCLRGHDPVNELPETFNGMNDEESSAQVSIDEFFNDPILTNLINEALTCNLQLKILGEQIQIANNEVLKRRGAYLPFVNIGPHAELQRLSDWTLPGASRLDDPLRNGKLVPNPMPDFLVAANFSWQIDIWRQLRNARDAACLRYLGTIEGRNYVVTRLVAEISENYYNLLALDRRMENLDRTIALQEQSLEIAQSKKEFAQGTELAVQRFRAEVRKNQSEKLIVQQDIIETENRINYLVGRYPQPVERSAEFFNLNLHVLRVGVPSDLLLNRPDIRQAELELESAGLDVLVARAYFYPRLTIDGNVGYQAFNTRYLFNPQSLVYDVAGNLVAPLINKKAIQADYMTANALQLQKLYDYQRVILNAFTEVINRMSMVQNYTRSIEIKKEQLQSLEASVVAAGDLFTAARIDYMDVLFAQRDLRDARMVMIDTKKQQLSAIVNTYQALGGGLVEFSYPDSNSAPAESMPPAPNAPVENAPAVVPVIPEKGGD